MTERILLTPEPEKVEDQSSDDPPETWMLNLFVNRSGVFEDAVSQLQPKPEILVDDREWSKKCYPNLTVQKCYFLLKTRKLPEQYAKKVEAIMMDIIRTNNMERLYTQIYSNLNKTVDVKLLCEMRTAKTQKLHQWAKESKTLREILIKPDLRKQSLMRLTKLYSELGETKVGSKILLKLLSEEKNRAAKRDILFHIIRISIFDNNMTLYRNCMAQLENICIIEKELLTSDQKVYEAYYALVSRDLEKAGTILLEIIHMFHNYELMSQEKAFFYAILAAMFYMDRESLKTEILNSDKILYFLNDQPLLKAYVKTLINCDYVNFLRCLIAIEERLKLDPVMSTYYKYYVAMMRLRAYTQLLSTYRNVKIAYVATLFGLDESFVKEDFVMFINTKMTRFKVDDINATIVHERRRRVANKENEEKMEQLKKRMVRLLQIFKSR